MTFEEYAAELSKVATDDRRPDIDWDRQSRLWIQLERKAERILSSIVPGVMCTAQEWDHRIDCTIRLADGSMVGEMVGLRHLTEDRLKQTGDRLRRLAEGEDVQLVDAVTSPRVIRPI
jgi:hypothetical protein